MKGVLIIILGIYAASSKQYQAVRKIDMDLYESHFHDIRRPGLFQVSMQEHESTGLQWTPRISSACTDLITLVDQNYKGSDSDLLGAPGKKTFLFDARQLDGKCKIYFVYAYGNDSDYIRETKQLILSMGEADAAIKLRALQTTFIAFAFTLLLNS